LNWFKVVTDPNYHQLVQGQPLPAAAQAIVDAAGLEPEFAGLASRIYQTADLARGKPATASSQWNGSTPPSAAVDWDFGTIWHQASGDPPRGGRRSRRAPRHPAPRNRRPHRISTNPMPAGISRSRDPMTAASPPSRCWRTE
jgi:hypothetical protein